MINVNTSDPRLRGLLNEVFAYVAASRPEYDLRLFADDAANLFRVLGREDEIQKAHSPQQIGQIKEQLLKMIQEPLTRDVTVEHSMSL